MINLRQMCIRRELKKFGGTATTKQIAEKVDLSVNGTAQTLGVMKDVKCLGGRYGDKKWQLITPGTTE